ncbi:MAG: hypothetical protein SOY42_01215 [Clostridium sp.]|nr:hypothetical protein [Clostridium sp.]
METNNEKLGAGIITISVLSLITVVFGLIGAINIIATPKEKFIEAYKLAGLDPATIPTVGQTIVSLILIIILGVSIILILMKKSIGVYGYFISQIISIISSIIFSGFSILNIVLGLILPVLMAIFISKKRNLFGL